MKVLLIDTSTEFGFTALIEDGKVIFHHFLEGGLTSAQQVMPTLDRKFKERSLAINSIDIVGVTIGPGSYTGLRLGAMIGKTLSFSLQKPLIGVPSLELYAADEDRFVVLLDARMGGVYLSCYENNRYSQPEVCSIAEFTERSHGIRLVVSPHSEQLKSRLVAPLTWEFAKPSAHLMYQAVMKRFKAKEYSLDGSVELLYLRRTQAEIEKERSS